MPTKRAINAKPLPACSCFRIRFKESPATNRVRLARIKTSVVWTVVKAMKRVAPAKRKAGTARRFQRFLGIRFRGSSSGDPKRSGSNLPGWFSAVGFCLGGVCPVSDGRGPGEAIDPLASTIGSGPALGGGKCTGAAVRGASLKSGSCWSRVSHRPWPTTLEGPRQPAHTRDRTRSRKKRITGRGTSWAKITRAGSLAYAAVMGSSGRDISVPLSPSNRPMSLIFRCGITSRAMKLRVMNGARRLLPKALTARSSSE